MSMSHFLWGQIFLILSHVEQYRAACVALQKSMQFSSNTIQCYSEYLQLACRVWEWILKLAWDEEIHHGMDRSLFSFQCWHQRGFISHSYLCTCFLNLQIICQVFTWFRSSFTKSNPSSCPEKEALTHLILRHFGRGEVLKEETNHFLRETWNL